MTTEQFNAEVARLRAMGFTWMHAQLTALQHFNVIRENCPEPEYWHYEILKPELFPDHLKRNYPRARGGYEYHPNDEFRSHIIYY